MRPILASGANHYATRIHPALPSFADECSGMLARLIAYVGALALLAIVGLSLWDELPLRGSAIRRPNPPGAWPPARTRHSPSASSICPEKQRLMKFFGIPMAAARMSFAGPRRAKSRSPRLEIYRPGGELGQSGPPIAEIAARMDPDGMRELEAAGVIDSKFGAVTLLGLAGRGGDARPCLGFMKGLDEPNLRISGWSCQGDTLPARRAAIGCMLNRLILLTAGNDPKLAELFAHAELKRGSCAPPSAAPVTSADWVTGAENPRLRGSL